MSVCEQSNGSTGFLRNLLIRYLDLGQLHAVADVFSLSAEECDLARGGGEHGVFHLHSVEDDDGISLSLVTLLAAISWQFLYPSL